MMKYYHLFHIPVMGTGHSVDTPIRVAPLGITSVISLVDDLLLEKVRKYYAEQYSLPYSRITSNEEDGRAKRITAYLDTVLEIVQKKMEKITSQPFFENNSKRKYFELLPDESFLKKKYKKLLHLQAGSERSRLEKDLTSSMEPGSIDVNIMVKVDRTIYDETGNPLAGELSDSKAGLRGYANSRLKSCIIFSAGINQRLYSYMTRFKDFYRDSMGSIKKRIVLKVSDFRSALIQGKFLAKKGLEVYEFRIESGLNCGGHAFPSNGILLPSLLKEFKEKRDSLLQEFRPLVKKYYKKMGWDYVESTSNNRPLITVQGGIGTNGEARRLVEDFGMDLTGWASPFLLVPETTNVDHTTRNLLRKARENDLYLSDVSPLGIPFNNIYNTGSEKWTRERIKQGKPGSPCPKGILVSDTEFTKLPICCASRKYQKAKLEQIKNRDISKEEKEKLVRNITQKTCICDHLANGALINLGILEEKKAPQSICPGPNIAWFDRYYTLEEMVDHIYGRCQPLVPENRPHMFAKEIVMYVDYFEKETAACGSDVQKRSELKKFKDNLISGLDYCLKIAHMPAYPGENLDSIKVCVKQQKARLESIYKRFLK